ncbi:GIY-YIG nuclease family protein [Lichenibacterium minor]|uniref:GIY-YIG nuclease family protein n=1 Tax=Lichenibacterium minor TaxID=2316528 RepID=A0A4Q2U6Q9_9HYPH|nr:GIY-YIG nuclease family protein [Lichenibacterium minor]RYC32012.1 GIY-YIG nuclease family protein [Lichenibacterium minor]
MRLTFNRLFDVEGITPDRVQLVRHQDARAGTTTSPYALWVDRDPGFELYQAIQARPVFRTDKGSLIASFVVTPAAETLFAGLYGIHGVGTAAPGTLDPVGGHDVSGINLYDLSPDPRLAFYIGKVVIEWGTGYRSWVQRAHKQDKEVVEVRREFREERFPGFVEFEATLSEVARLPRGWRAILSSSRGVYLLTCPRTREQYVGSATGEGGFVARWEQHAAKGGDAVKFRSREPSDYSVTVLEVAGSTATTHDVQVAEQRWIRKLRSVDMGLNGNPGGQAI